jgi:hypothetical protein
MALRGMPSILGRFGVLGHDHAALALDRPHAQRTVAAGAGEDDANRPFVLILGQRAKEENQSAGAGRAARRFQQLQRCRSGKAMSRLGGMIPFPGRFCSFQGSKTVPFVIPAKAGIPLFGG